MAIEETKENQKLHSLFILVSFIIVSFDILYYGALFQNSENLFLKFLKGFSKLGFLKTVLLTKLSTIVILSLTGIGTVSKKKYDLNIVKAIIVPLVGGLLFIFSCVLIHTNMQGSKGVSFLPGYTYMQLLYVFCSILGAIAYIIAIGNITKILKSNFGKDEWNLEAESFLQEKQKIEDDTSINIPTQFYYKKKVHDGWININPFRGVMIIGVPGSGKSFGIINPTIRQMIEKNFSMCLYDFKYPSLANIAYYRYLKTHAENSNYSFKVLNLDNIEDSVRVNPLHPRYITNLAEAQETATCIVEALQRSDSLTGSDKFFTKSAVDLLAASIYFLAKYEKGKYSDVPHLICLITAEYQVLFDILYSNDELTELLSTFYSTYKNKSFDQLEGQAATLRVFLSALATKETYYIFGEEELSLDLSNPDHPTILVLASDPNTQDINSTLFALVVNRITKLVNHPGNVPFGLIVDELPTLYVHKIENLVSTARSNKVGVILGLQEIPQLRKQYGKENASTITSVIANTFSGAAKDESTLKWLESLFGKKKQVSESLSINRRDTSHSINEKLECVIPQSRISQLSTGEIVGMFARDIIDKTAKNWTTQVPPLINCKINLDKNDLEKENQNLKPIPKSREFSKEFDEYLILNMRKIRKDISIILEAVKPHKEEEKTTTDKNMCV